MAGRRANAVYCSDTCRQAGHRAKVGKSKAPMVTREAKRVQAEELDGLDLDTTTEPTEDTPTMAGHMESATVKKLDELGVEWQDDPLALHLLNMAHVLDNPSSVAPGTLTGMGKSFREAYKDYLKANAGGAPTRASGGNGTPSAQDEAAALLAALGGAS